MDLTEILKASRRFFREHNLDDWRRSTPKKVHLGPDAELTRELARKSGFQRGFAFPPFDLQMASFERLVDETARKPASILAENQQYAHEPVLSNSWNAAP